MCSKLGAAINVAAHPLCVWHQQAGCAARKARTRGFSSIPPAWHVVDSISSPQAISRRALMAVGHIDAVLFSSCLVGLQ